MKTFREDLKLAVDYHGHLCSGQIIGVRMARLALKYFGIEDPNSFRDLLVYVETDRCIADAIGTVCNCSMGRRKLKWMDLGKVAATFYNIETGKALRISKKQHLYPDNGEEPIGFFEAYKDEDLFNWSEVSMLVPKHDMPGKPEIIEVCEVCGEEILDNRHLTINGKIICKGCHTGNYYTAKAH